MRNILRSMPLLTVLLSLLPSSACAQVNVGTNVLYDLAVLPSLSIEAGVGERLSLAGSLTYGQMEGWPWRQDVRMGTADIELRRWLRGSEPMRRGHHVGAYVAGYHYDIQSGSHGWQARFNWGVGVSWGYMTPLSRRLALNFGLGVGYVGGSYKKYAVSSDVYRHKVWTGDRTRYYFGPTKAEVSLIWLIGSAGTKKGGSR